MYSKSKIDKCSKILNSSENSELDKKEANLIFDYWRKMHIEPLTEISLKIQEWLVSEYNNDFYLAQRLKRKPQILRKLKRFSTRLTQLQDIGGCRIIVDSNKDVDIIESIIMSKNKKSHYFKVLSPHDYREKGRDDSGYRALHIIVKRKNVFIEIQVRSKIQHYWAESIERTSVIAGFHFKELMGPEPILQYFKHLSNLLYDIENQINIKKELLDKIEKQRLNAEKIIKEQDSYKVLESTVNESFIQSMIGKEKSLRKSKINSWMIVFNWKEGQFLYWVHIDKNPNTAIEMYSEYEQKWPESDGYEVVLISSSSVFTIQETHSHYFGIENFDHILDSLEVAKFKLRTKNELNRNSVHILDKLYSHKFIGNRVVSLDTIKNHICLGVANLEKELTLLIEKEYLKKEFAKDLYSINKCKIKEVKELTGR